MRIDVAPTLRRLLIDLALGRDSRPFTPQRPLCWPVEPDTIADRASDLIAATSALAYLREARTPEAPEAARLSRSDSRARRRAGHEPGRRRRLALGRPSRGPRIERPVSDRSTSAHACCALASARSVGLLPDPSSLDKATNYLAAEFTKAGNDYEARAATLLHALAAAGKASFEQANSLNRVRQNLPDSALAYLALTLAHLDRASLAGEVLDVLAPRAKTRTGRRRQEAPQVLGGGRPGAVPPRGRRDHRAGGPRLRQGPAPEPANSKPPPSGSWPIAEATAGPRTRPRARPSPPSPPTMARPARPRTAIAWSSP